MISRLRTAFGGKSLPGAVELTRWVVVSVCATFRSEQKLLRGS